jgi:colanic acid/amylovoran biosynthesis protein
LAERRTERPLIAITVRELAPFDKRLGTTQKAYEEAFAGLINKLIECGYDVVAASTCTGIDGYFRDDRMNALRIGSIVGKSDHFYVVMDELDDVELGELFSQCELLIGTRLHSAIISMNFGTPAVAIMYEHKSEGVMQQLGLPELSKSVQSLLDGTLTRDVQSLLPSLVSLRSTVADAVARERKKVFSMVEESLASVTARSR